MTSLNIDLQHISTGVVTLPGLIDNGNGTCTIDDTGVFRIRDNPNGLNLIKMLNIPGTGATPFIIAENTVYYVVIDWNSGSPVMSLITNKELINQSDVIRIKFYLTL